MQTRLILTMISLLAAACGDDGGTTTPDTPPPDIGFNKPAAPLKANNNNTEVGAAELGCLNMASTDQATTPDKIMLTTTVKDFQNGDPVPNAMVTAFNGIEIDRPFDTKTADSMAKVTIDIPKGTKRFGFKMKAQGSLDTLLLNQIVDPGMATQTTDSIDIISNGTATTLPVLIGKQRTPGTGVLAGAVRDCQGRAMSNFIATVSSTKSTVTHLEGALSYYFDAASGLPVRHTVIGSGSPNGLFMVIEMAPTAMAYVQVWGYPTDADLAADRLTLISELQAPVIADTVITGSYAPLRTGP
jgi:hypothetical protein